MNTAKTDLERYHFTRVLRFYAQNQRTTTCERSLPDQFCLKVCPFFLPSLTVLLWSSRVPEPLKSRQNQPLRHRILPVHSDGHYRTYYHNLRASRHSITVPPHSYTSLSTCSRYSR
ncbi:serine threonine-protein kinase [Moniliophthora roreri]|nr:serine threonine-protein kinase [Moniliophthora roreri]